MPRRRTPCHLAALLAACLGSLAAGTGIARASIISSSPAFPPHGAPFLVLTGLGCFPTAGFCTTNGAISFSPADPPTSTFDPSTGQDIKGDATFTGMLTTLGPNPVPIGSFSFPGTIEMGVAGRMSDTETGTWSAEIDSLSLTASVQGGTLTVGLQTTPSSTGMVSVEPVAGQDGLFRIDSFFDVFVDLTFDQGLGGPPLHADRGPILVALAPEPASFALLIGPILGLAAVRRNRRAH